ncbi:MAG: putative sugar transferase EpsL [Candidatus Accumulibacter regalis]|uniref:Sugar transferase EpsL n=1 Tax=Accumulibacter regalis TaxID=522306 RepID=A0A011QPM8_ACCRE|nr:MULTISPECIES: TIGR03013 family XrtA/PEP-CTERM system glycosyltransferase [unclassified Candidatus Accumulibacter]EXI91005.1 MAG: putative sugar transferase EpsL [Candidatus Accumulibacter regalis]MQM33747.1 sugar transferase [Candidatus Accumulibacter phosphatis]MBL8369543.1 TIGR03013 family PEP-CTERM/XrtA system glycosyltransferase [Accumulibacter sp.]MBN8513912.1 TIGR03013 family PEP-CTERM/XrtA system glycosyltransferase [Accumulibacter sp.]MBO3702107.1 TIGR03013 family PEP-CTERM/XrtA sys
MIKVFNHWFYRATIARVAIDLMFPVVCVILVAVWVGRGGEIALEKVAFYALIFALMSIAFNAWLGIYQRVHSRTRAETRARAVLSLYLAIPLAYVVFSMLSVAEVDRGFMLLSGLAALFATLLHRVHSAHSRSGLLLSHRVLVFGAGDEAENVGRVLRKSDPDIHIVGFYPSPTDTELVVPAQVLLSRDMSLSDTAHSLKVDEIIVAVRERRGGALPLRELLDCKLSGVKVLDLASYFERALGQIRIDSLRVSWLIFGDGFRQSWRRTAVKRLFDIVAASFLLLLAAPVMLLTMLMIILEDGFSVFYRQERVGLDGRLFNVIKFRSMRKDAESDGQPRWATANDDRVTRVGRIIRKLRIDELPQLYSVLTGDMSLVGPRPERPYFVDQLTRDVPFYAVRHSVKPGVTGWAQVSYHYGSTVDDSIQKLQYDLFYVKNHSLFLDVVILFQTVGVVLTGKGAQ